MLIDYCSLDYHRFVGKLLTIPLWSQEAQSITSGDAGCIYLSVLNSDQCTLLVCGMSTIFSLYHHADLEESKNILTAIPNYSVQANIRLCHVLARKRGASVPSFLVESDLMQ